MMNSDKLYRKVQSEIMQNCNNSCRHLIDRALCGATQFRGGKGRYYTDDTSCLCFFLLNIIKGHINISFNISFPAK